MAFNAARELARLSTGSETAVAAILEEPPAPALLEPA
jgi:hypothetical protein